MKPETRWAAAWVASGLGLTACVAYWVATGDQTRTTDRHLVVFVLAAVCYLVALRASRDSGPRAVVLALALSVLWRAALVPVPPLVSDDVYGYVWQGRIQLYGGNPYAWGDRPESERFEFLHDDVWRDMAHKRFTALYPPFFTLFCRAVAAVSDTVWAMKAAMVLSELAALGVLAALLLRRGLPVQRLLIWAWSPLAIVELAGSGHNDGVGLLFLLLALLALDAGRAWPAAAFASLAIGAKLLPALALAPWFRRFRPLPVAAGVGLAALTAWPYLDAGAGLWRTLAVYTRIGFNESLFALLRLLPGGAATARLVVALALLGLALYLGWRRCEAALAGLMMTGAWLALCSNLLPWYALWLMPWLVLRGSWAGLTLTLTTATAYTLYPSYLAGGPWQVSVPARLFEFGLPLAVGAVEVWRARVSRAVTEGRGRVAH